MSHYLDKSVDWIQDGLGELLVVVDRWGKLVGESTLRIGKDVVLHRVFSCHKVESNLFSF